MFEQVIYYVGAFTVSLGGAIVIMRLIDKFDRPRRR